ncbi:hypothetical protein [Cellulomonas endophytica]|uniref:hypothetical protein n=1 Tax=Cellulomonas endophytica TaxID=2494735 RepID=UPI0010100C23|nr:hypothetical protein [Cellulomonas endophytica]
MTAQRTRTRRSTRTRTRARATAAAVLALGAVLATAPGASAKTPGVNDPAYWEFGGVYACSHEERPFGTSWLKPDGTAFVVIRAGGELFVSDLGDSNDGDRTYTFDKRIRSVITCQFTDA